VKKYKAPIPLAESHFEEDDKIQKQKRREEAAIRRAAKSAMAREIFSAYSDRPEETPQIGALEREDDDDEDLRRQQYEEDSFIRLQLSKKKKHKLREKSKHRDDLEVLKYSLLHLAIHSTCTEIGRFQ
jgi:hypothetical protein